MSGPNYLTATDAFTTWRDNVLTGKPPTLYRVAEDGPLRKLEVGPGLINLIGGAPGSGKTALVIQAVFDALRLNDSLRAVVCNVEMSPDVLLDRQLARLSGVPMKFIRYRSTPETYFDRIEAGIATIEAIADRICFVRPPYSLENIAATVDAFAPVAAETGTLLVVDYVQRLVTPGQVDRRGAVDETMTGLRQIAAAGVAVVAVSSVGRQRDARGRSSYAAGAMNLASFKESGELEFGADDAFILIDDIKRPDGRILKHLKSRYGKPEDLKLTFRGAYQRFEAAPDDSQGRKKT